MLARLFDMRSSEILVWRRKAGHNPRMGSVWLGTSGFGYKEWKPSFYPPDVPAQAFLQYYAGKFNSVEIDYTFYRIPNSKTIANWKDQTPPPFRFALKASRQITHRERLLRVRQENVQNSMLKVEMERVLKTQAKVQVVSGPPSVPVLTLYDEQSETRAVSVDQNVRVSEFLITYHVSFDVRDASGKEIVKRQRITLQRNFSFDKNAQLAMERQAQEIQESMRTDAVQQIMRRLAASKS